jgi:hypothetical protein
MRCDSGYYTIHADIEYNMLRYEQKKKDKNFEPMLN